MKKLSLVPHVGMKVFNESPIKLAGWELRHNAAVPIGKPTIDETATALEFSVNVSEVSPYWVGDIARYAESRQDWKDKIDQLIAITDYDEKTIVNLASLARHVGEDARNEAPSVGYAKLVQKFPAKEQVSWLRKAKTEGWKIRDLDVELKAHAKRTVAKGSADLEGMFRVWYVDYPWLYAQKQPSKTGAQTHYKGMAIDVGCAMGDAVRAHTTKNAVGFFWVTSPMLYYASDGISPDPFRLITAWGFDPKTSMIWDKVMHNFGHYVSVRHELLIIATRGSCTPDRPVPQIDSVLTVRRSDTHSEKPPEFRKAIEQMYDGPRVEMFARSQHKGWTAWGDQINAPMKQKTG